MSEMNSKRKHHYLMIMMIILIIIMMVMMIMMVPILETLVGIVIVVRDEHPLKAPSPNDNVK